MRLRFQIVMYVTKLIVVGDVVVCLPLLVSAKLFFKRKNGFFPCHQLKVPVKMVLGNEIGT